MSTTRPDRQAGFSIVAAIFIVVVLAGLGAFIVSVSSTQNLTQALDVMNSRAAQAARTGIEWGVYQVAKAPSAAFATGCNGGAGYGGAPAATQTLSGLAGLAGFTVAVTCHSQSYQEGGEPAYRVYQIVATACNAAACPAAAPGQGYVEHQQVARVRP